jgi:hypothetical protein
MSFGRKGLAPGEVAPAAAGGFGRAPTAAWSGDGAPAALVEADEIAARREAFIASERARRAEEMGLGGSESASDPLSSLRNEARPAQPRAAEPVGPSGLTPTQEAEIRAAARGMARGEAPRIPGSPVAASGERKKYIFGDPHKRSLGIAYLIWFVLGQTGLHRVYCGRAESAIYQVALLVGSFVAMLIFPPFALGFIFWMAWIVGDLFLMPGMLRQFKQETDHTAVFA